MNDKQLDKYIKENLKAMIDGPVPVDIEKSWEDFEQRLTEEKNTKRSDVTPSLKSKRFVSIAVVMVFTIITTALIVPQEVQAFKDRIFQWFSISEDNYTVIKDEVNPDVEPGFYDQVTLEEAQNLTIYPVKVPNYLPDTLDNPPRISVNVGEYPFAVTDLQYVSEEAFLSIRQQNLIGENSSNTYVPNNLEVEKVTLFDNETEALMIKKDTDYQIIWTLNSIKYTLTSKNVPFQRLMKIIESL